MVRNKHQENSTYDKESNNGIDWAMKSSFEFMPQTPGARSKSTACCRHLITSVPKRSFKSGNL